MSRFPLVVMLGSLVGHLTVKVAASSICRPLFSWLCLLLSKIYRSINVQYGPLIYLQNMSMICVADRCAVTMRSLTIIN